MKRIIVFLLGAGLALTATAGTGPAQADGGLSGTVHVQPLAVELAFSRTSINTGQTARAIATVSNLGGQPVTGASVRLRISDNSVLLDPDADVDVGTLGPHSGARVTWRLCAEPSGLEPITYLAIAQVHAVAGQRELHKDSPARSLHVSSAPKLRGQAGRCK